MAHSTHRTLACAAFTLLACLFAGPASAKDGDYPNKPIKLIVAFAAGTGTDTTARLISNPIAEQTGQPVVVDNRAGANGFIAAQAVAGAPADGYTFLVTTSTTHAVNAALFKRLPYDPIKDFAPVSLLTKAGLVLVVRSGGPIRTVDDLVKQGQARPGRLNFAGANAASRVAGELFNTSRRTKATYVPYKSVPQALADILGGQVDFMFSDISTALGQIQSGKLTALAVTTATRHPAFAEVPTLSESGMAGFELGTWTALFAPAGTPRHVIDRMNQLVHVAKKSKAAREHTERSGSQDAEGTPEELAAFVQSETQKWAQLVKAAGIEPE